jgi:hypothetical protein
LIKSTRKSWAGHVARRGKRENHKHFWWGNLKIRKRLKDLGIDGRNTVTLFSREQDG